METSNMKNMVVLKNLPSNLVEEAIIILKSSKKVKKLEKEVELGKITSKEAHKYLSGHMGYIKYANTENLENKLFYMEEK